ncbi:TMEM175 family protein [Limosilactobacillus reuteri]|uniref:TMEM175 family protein n=1 Tax=Limosilactobacillus reuteri TaxID=1598 RepID=UPI001E37678F|nr:TMEM175 family protein [Limosilactobacillus reuteri]MCC4347159.1 TMEM175 family protein [Limosilactobacillus reuteri]MCC4374167.1 TMEM175 family protein [Limosilactobacillus reuteri]MCC4384572.1 TMEM175 family protein [Limosilactobacillus reuteri]
MNKERLSAFADAVLAIIITILVLELEKPSHLTLTGFMELWPNYMAYTISFFWLGAMWINMHNEWYSVKRITTGTLWATLIVLFFSSLFPYATNIVSANYDNRSAQVFYGIIVLLITFANMNMYASIAKSDSKASLGEWIKQRSRGWMLFDVAIKVIGLILAVTVYPPAMLYSVLVTLLCLVIPNQIKHINREKR